MKKKLFLFLLILIFILVALAIFFPHATKENDSPSPVLVTTLPEKKIEETKSDNIKATSKNYGEASEKYKYQIDFNYPFFDGQDNKKIMDTINSQVEKNVQVEVDKYIAEARKNKIAPIFGYLVGTYEYSVSSDKLLSVKIEMEKYLSGGARPQILHVTWNFDLESGKQITSP